MMDNFVEQIVNKKPEGRDTLLRIGIMVGCSVIAAIAILCALYIYLPIFVLAIGAVYLMWFLLTGTSVEYEYIITNNELDIDKITGKRKRKRLITLQLNTTESWGEYKDGEGEKAQVTVSAHDCRYINLWYMVCRHEKHGKTLLLFTPNQNILITINKAVPYNLRKREITQAAMKIEETEPITTIDAIFKKKEADIDNEKDKIEKEVDEK